MPYRYIIEASVHNSKVITTDFTNSMDANRTLIVAEVELKKKIEDWIKDQKK